MNNQSIIPKEKLPTTRSKIKQIRIGKRLNPQEKLIRHNVLDAISLVRRKKHTLLKASKMVGLPKKLVLNLSNNFHKVSGRWKIKAYDRIPRSLVIYEKGRKRIVEVKDSRNSSLIGEYHNIIREFLETGDSSVLKSIRRKQFKDSKGRVHFLETRPEKIYNIKEREAKYEFFDIYSG